MRQENDMKKELLKQMNKESDKIYSGTDSVREIFAKDTARVRRMKWLTVFSWIVVVILFIVAGVVEHNTKGLEGSSSLQNMMWLNIILFILLSIFLLAIVFTVSFYMRLRTLNIKQVQARLSEIEEAIKQISTEQ